MPVPSPAALAILEGYPVVHRDSEYEMTTPTGATLIRTLSEGLLPAGLTMKPEKTGYGAGSKTTGEWPNVLRMVIAETENVHDTEQIFILESQMDDLNPEFYPHLMERLLEEGAKDVYLTPVIMKKGRPGTKITVLTAESYIRKLENILFVETSTLGIRRFPVHRTTLDRETRQISTRYGSVGVKVSRIDGRERIHPEYEQCLKISREKGISLIEIYREIEAQNIK